MLYSLNLKFYDSNFHIDYLSGYYSGKLFPLHSILKAKTKEHCQKLPFIYHVDDLVKYRRPLSVANMIIRSSAVTSLSYTHTTLLNLCHQEL